MAGTIWERFELDPRRPENAPLRASDRDRDIVQDVLGTAYSEGRLTRDELDERSEEVARSKTLGELPPLVRDLVSSAPAGLAPMSVSERHEAAELKYRRMRHSALMGFLTPTLICWAIWAATMLGGFPWPVFVTIGTGIRWVQLATNRRDTVASIESSMARRERRRLEQQSRRQRRPLGPGPWPFSEER
ncbi:MAG: DUF1707 domain-containing protein [Marmoricola sp.]|nr:DUF1707 domain-containing protein [Marmoricola sp.]